MVRVRCIGGIGNGGCCLVHEGAVLAVMVGAGCGVGSAGGGRVIFRYGGAAVAPSQAAGSGHRASRQRAAAAAAVCAARAALDHCSARHPGHDAFQGPHKLSKGRPVLRVRRPALCNQLAHLLQNRARARAGQGRQQAGR
jgi:hypothetical protein